VNLSGYERQVSQKTSLCFFMRTFSLERGGAMVVSLTLIGKSLLPEFPFSYTLLRYGGRAFL